MVKKTKIKYLLKAIRKTGVSFFAVALIAATSIAIYLGIQSGAVTILQYADKYFKDNRLATMEIACSNGITQDDIEELKKQPEVDVAEGGYRTMVIMDSEKEKIIVQVRSLLEKLNQANVLEGQLPKADDEVAIEEKIAIKQGIKLGDEIHVNHDGELVSDTFKVTAIINEPSFSCTDVQDSRGKGEVGFGSASYYVEVSEKAFNSSYYNNCYTTAYVENSSLNDIYFYSDEYADKESQLINSLNEFGKDRAKIRYDFLSQAAGVNKNITNVQQKDWVITGRNSMGDVSGIEVIVEGLFTLSYSFAFIFLLVAVVVCYAAVVKMIDNQRTLIGVQKALGFKTKEIFSHYLFYNILCSVLGIIIGCIAAVGIVENLVLYVFGMEFFFKDIPLSFSWKEAGIVAVLCIVIFIAATCAGCIKVVRQPAISLLRGELPTQEKAYFFEKWGIYKKLNLYSRTMIKNVLSDKGRILTTIMGVVGCLSLVIITFTLKFSISNATDVQFENYFLYENRLAVNSEIGNVQNYEKILEKEGIAFTRIQDKLHNFRIKGENWETIHVIALESEEQIKDYIYLEDIETEKQAKLPTYGVLISRKCAENNNLKKGSIIEIMDAEGNPIECKIAGVMEHYLPYHQIVSSAEYYEKIMDKKADECVFLLKGNIDGLYEKVKNEAGFMSLKDNSEYKDPFTSINLVIGICLFFSGVLAVLVLLNQMSMYINRKTKELAVMRINGYTLKETKSFVSKDNVVLVALGLILGCVIGNPLAQLEVCVMETGTCRYIRTPNLMACVLSVAVCIIFAVVINKIALRKIDRLSLTNVNVD